MYLLDEHFIANKIVFVLKSSKHHVFKRSSQLSLTGDRRDHGSGHAVPACVGAPDPRETAGHDRAGSELSLCW